MQPSTEGVVSLKGYVSFWGWAFTAVTVAIALFKTEYDHPLMVDARERRREARHGAKAATANGAAKGGKTCSRDANGVLVNGHAEEPVVDWSARRRELMAAYVQLWEVVRGMQ